MLEGSLAPVPGSGVVFTILKEGGKSETGGPAGSDQNAGGAAGYIWIAPIFGVPSICDVVDADKGERGSTGDGRESAPR